MRGIRQRHLGFRPRSARPIIEMEMTPLIDVVFLQLIFFMLTSSFVFLPGVKIHLPKTVTTDVAAKENLVISISKEGHLFLGNRVVTLQELQTSLRKTSRSEQPVLIRADQGTPLGRVVEVWDACRAQGLSQVQIATHAIPADNTAQTR